MNWEIAFGLLRSGKADLGLPPAVSFLLILVFVELVHSTVMRAGLTIGEFARLTQLSVRTLRRYHEGGLLAHATVDAGSGYRYCSTEQVPAAQITHRLRELGMP